MTIVFTVYFFLLGLLITSFTNVVGLRVPVGESIVHPRSHCPTCGHVLGPLELTPYSVTQYSVGSAALADNRSQSSIQRLNYSEGSSTPMPSGSSAGRWNSH